MSVLFDYLLSAPKVYFDQLTGAVSNATDLGNASLSVGGQNVDATIAGPWTEGTISVTGQAVTLLSFSPLQFNFTNATLSLSGQDVQLPFLNFFLNATPATLAIGGQGIGLAAMVTTNPTHINWNDPIGIPLEDISGFQIGIRHQSAKGFYTILPPMAFPSARSQQIPNLPPGDYAASVMTFTYSNGPSAWSRPEILFSIGGLGAPTNVTIDGNGVISWTGSSGATAYQVGIRLMGGAGFQGNYPVVTPASIATTAQFPQYLPPGQYSVSVQALGAGTASLWSTEVLYTISTQPPPTNVFVS